MEKVNDYTLYLSGIISENEYHEMDGSPQVANSTTPAAPADPTSATANVTSKVGGNLSANQLMKYFPDQNPAIFRAALNVAMRGGQLNRMQMQILGNAFVDLLRADEKTTLNIMRLIKKVSAEG